MAAASIRFLHPSTNRHFPQFFHLRNPNFHLNSPKSQPLHSHSPSPTLSLYPHNPNPPKFTHRPFLKPPNFPISHKNLNLLFFGTNATPFTWNFAPNRAINDRNNPIIADRKGPEVAVVLLGWLGAKPKHLRKYVELYNGEGVHALTFVVSVMDAVSIDLGKKVERNVGRLTSEIVSWLSSNEGGGRERFLVFHTFSNTGWLA